MAGITQQNNIFSNPTDLISKKAGKTHIVKISSKHNGLQISGPLQEGLSISYSPEYTSLFNAIPMIGNTIKGFVESASEQAGIYGGAQLFDGIHTQKMYKGASDIKINVNFKVVDYNGNGAPLKAAAALGIFCQPNDFPDQAIKELYSLLKDSGKTAAEEDDGNLNIGNIVTSFFSSVGGGLNDLKDDALKKFNYEKIQKYIEEFNLSSMARRVVSLEISDYFAIPDMVIDSVTQNFSYDQTISGPMVADFAVSLTTLRTPDASDIARYFKSGKNGDGLTSSRVNIIGGQ